MAVTMEDIEVIFINIHSLQIRGQGWILQEEVPDLDTEPPVLFIAISVTYTVAMMARDI